MGIEDFFRSETIPTWIKWVVTILVTGFIAQFGKRLADFLIKKFRARKEKQTALPPVENPNQESQALDPLPTQESKKILKAKAKLEKKQAKAGIKGTKKGKK